jgi:hypothetical protein
MARMFCSNCEIETPSSVQSRIVHPRRDLVDHDFRAPAGRPRTLPSAVYPQQKAPRLAVNEPKDQGKDNTQLAASVLDRERTVNLSISSSVIVNSITRRHPAMTRKEAIVEVTVRRARPVVLTALAAILAMIPLSRSAFWGPMAITIMGGLFVATFLTLLYLPGLRINCVRLLN